MIPMDIDGVHRGWADRTGEYSPGYYAYYGPDEASERILETLETSVDRGAAILELGCSAGRHLAHLANNGYRDLYGIDINPEAFDVMERTYPDLADDGTFFLAAIEDVIGEFPDDRFDVVYSVETLQHIHHASEWVFREVARVTAALLITVEIEAGAVDRPDEGAVKYVRGEVPLYYRDWKAVFTELGFVQTDTAALDTQTFRAFSSDPP